MRVDLAVSGGSDSNGFEQALAFDRNVFLAILHVADERRMDGMGP